MAELDTVMQPPTAIYHVCIHCDRAIRAEEFPSHVCEAEDKPVSLAA